MASKDFSRRVSDEELKILRDSVNSLEAGEPELTQEKWPTPSEGFIGRFYVDHVIVKFRHSFERGVELRVAALG